MNTVLLDVGLIAWLVIGTLLIKAMLRRALHSTSIKFSVYLVAIALSAIPIIAIRNYIAGYSAVSVVLAGIGIFWFGILASRSGNAI
jgi:predicted lysophospholipase L1 biosynthesis ABC-type transport system permease subunit